MRHFTWSLLAAGLLLANSGASQAQDTVRLGGPAALNDIDGGADTAFVRWGRGGYYGGYYRGGYGYGYRSYYAGYGYYRPYYRGYYGYGFGFYAPPVYYYNPYIYYGAPSYYYPISATSAPTPTVQARASYSEQLPPPGSLPTMPPVNNGTYPYDGGPRTPVPMPPPGEEFSPANQLRSIVPIDGKLALLPSETTMGSFLLTGVQTPTPSKSAAVPSPRSGYAAYGEDPFTTPVRKR
jgi:hypothetical protein